jgi:hypothetical protein
MCKSNQIISIIQLLRGAGRVTLQGHEPNDINCCGGIIQNNHMKADITFASKNLEMTEFETGWNPKYNPA